MSVLTAGMERMRATAVLEGLRVPVGPFTDEVTDGGRINVRKLATALDQPMTVIAPALGFKPRWLNENPTATNAQPMALVLLGAVNQIAGAVGGKNAAILYLKTAQPDFKGKTPAEKLKKGQLESFAGYIGEVVTMRPD